MGSVRGIHGVIGFLVLLCSPASLAKQELDLKPRPAFEMNYGSEVFTRESIVQIGSAKYRKVEYKTDVVYLRLMESEGSMNDAQARCESAGASAFNSTAQSQVLVGVQVTKRTLAFVEGLKQICQDLSQGKRVVLSPELKVGFTYDDPDPRALLKNKTILVNPFSPNALGFRAEW